ncbi:MAG: DUF6588 family protein [Bacteroidota bacterium]
MKSIVKYFLVATWSIVLISGISTAQSVSDQISRMGSQAVEGYLNTAFLGWAADLNSGVYHTADIHNILGFDVQLKVAANLVKNESKSYTFIPDPTYTIYGYTLTRGVNYDNTLTAPTLFGEDKDVPLTIRNTNNPLVDGKAILTLPRGIKLPFAGVPLPWLQASIGLPFGLEVAGRFLPTRQLGDAGKINLIGFGIRYDVSQWIPLSPVDLSVHFMTTKFNLKDSVDNNLIIGKGTSYGLEVSKSLLIFTLYAGYQLESGSVTLNDYTGTVFVTDPITGNQVPTQLRLTGFSKDDENKGRLTVGLRVLLFILNVQAEYSFTKTPTATLGVGFSFR